jgi:microcystin-dependent protein
MGSPVRSDDFTAVTGATSACDGFKRLLRIPGLLNQFLSWLLDADGNLSESAADGISDYLTPIGSIIMWGGASLPSAKWLVCNGQAVSRVTYASLFLRYGTVWGSGDGSTTFNLPNFQGLIPRGVSITTPLGAESGSDQVTLTPANIPDLVSGHIHGVGRRSGGGAIDSDNNDFEFIMREWTKVGTHHWNALQGQDSLTGSGDFTDNGNVATTEAIITTPPSSSNVTGFSVLPKNKSVLFIIKVL